MDSTAAAANSRTACVGGCAAAAAVFGKVHGLPVPLAHAVVSALGLLGAALDLAPLGLGTVPLAVSLRFDDPRATGIPAQPLVGFVGACAVADLTRIIRSIIIISGGGASSDVAIIIIAFRRR